MTAQIPDYLIYEGHKTRMMSCPDLPQDHPRIVKLSKEEIAKENIDPIIFSTACWRGYVGVWEVKNGQLYLLRLIGKYKVLGSDPIPADWFSGTISIPMGNPLEDERVKSRVWYEQEVRLTIDQGKVVNVLTIDYRR